MSIDLWWPVNYIGCQLLGKSFVGGWSVEDVLRTGAELKKRGYGVTYNLLTEDLKDRRKVTKTLRAIQELIDSMDNSNRGNVAVKPTQLGIEISLELFADHAEHIVEHARMKGIEVEFDAERWEVLRAAFIVLGTLASEFHLAKFMRVCVPAHLRNIRALLTQFDLWGVNLRIVKGSGVYPESSNVSVIRDPKEVKEHYFYIGRRTLDVGRLPFFATMRDRTIVDGVKNTKIPYMLGPIKPPIQMLFGPLGREHGEELLAEGYPVRVYIPFVVDWCKKEWKPYGMRRAATIRRLFFEDKEVRRAIMGEIKNQLLGATKKERKKEGCL